MTVVDICNHALAILGHDRTITSLGDGSAEASRCSLFYPVARDNVLSSFSWEFACRELDVASGTEFSLPGDCLRVVAVYDSSGAIPCVRGEGTITPSRSGKLRYVTSDIDVSKLPHLVAEAITAELAFQLFGPIVGNPNSKDEVEVHQSFSALAQAKLEAAKSSDIEEHAYTGAPANADEVADLDICNRALAVLGNDRTIYSLAYDPSAEAVRCRQLLPMAKRHVLSAHAWEFASRTDDAEDGDDLPADYVRLVGAYDLDGRPAVCRVVAGKVSGSGVASIRYVSSSVGVSAYPARVQEAVMMALAMSLASTVSAGQQGGAEALKNISDSANAALASAVQQEIDEATYRATPENPDVAARTDICNRALATVGSQVVLKDYATDITAEANRCRQFLPVAIRTTLKAHDWDFATAEQVVCLHPGGDGWTRERKPEGCVRIIGVVNKDGNPLRIRSTSDALWIDSHGCDVAWLRFVSDDIDLDEAPVEFVESIVYRLASLLAGSLGLSPNERANFTQLAEAKLSSAITEESNETGSPGEWDNPFLAARR